MAECIVGDLTPSDPVTPEEKHIREMAAMKSLVDNLNSNLAHEFYDAFVVNINTSSCHFIMTRLNMFILAIRVSICK